MKHELECTMVVDARNANEFSDSAAVISCWPQMNSHRWARTSLHHLEALAITASTRGSITSLTTGQSFASLSGVRWKNYLLPQVCADP